MALVKINAIDAELYKCESELQSLCVYACRQEADMRLSWYVGSGISDDRFYVRPYVNYASLARTERIAQIVHRVSGQIYNANEAKFSELNWDISILFLRDSGSLSAVSITFLNWDEWPVVDQPTPSDWERFFKSYDASEVTTATVEEIRESFVTLYLYSNEGEGFRLTFRPPLGR